MYTHYPSVHMRSDGYCSWVVCVSVLPENAILRVCAASVSPIPVEYHIHGVITITVTTCELYVVCIMSL